MIAASRWPRPTRGSILLALSGWVALGLTFLPAGSALRAAGAVVFVLLCPGAALVRRWPEKDRLTRLVLAVAGSMAVTVLVAEGLLLAGTRSARLALVVLAIVTSVAAMVPAGWGAERRSRS